MTKSNNPYVIPVAILIAGVCISAAVLYTGGSFSYGGERMDEEVAPNEISIQPISENDHIRGSRDAELFLVEFSDIECPFCKNYHTTLEQIIDEFGDGRVAWVYRHFPLESIHPQALVAAHASECVAGEAGEDAFWVYLDTLFEQQGTLTPELYINEAIARGVSEERFNICMTEAEYLDDIRAHIQDAVDAGGRGTPYTVLVTKEGENIPLDGGALQYAQLADIIEKTLAQ